MHDEVVMSLVRMAQIESFDADTGVAVCEAGVVLSDLDGFLRDRGFVAPLDLGASGTCTVGGNLATNAGGIRFVRYGSLRGSTVGVEFVAADGTVVDCARFRGRLSFGGRRPLGNGEGVSTDSWARERETRRPLSRRTRRSGRL